LTDYVDIYQMHWPDHHTPLEETAEALQIIKDSGKIRYIGLSNFAQSDADKMMELVGVDCQQNLYNMLERNARSYHNIPLEYKTEDEVIPNVRKHGQAFLPYTPLFQGLLAGRFLDSVDFSSADIRNENPKFSGDLFKLYQDIARKLKEFSDEIGHPMSEVSLNWLRQKPEVTAIIAGVSSVKNLNRNLNCFEWELTPEELSVINGIIEPVRDV
jgi:aryl-alcohol dehydrogenase-like predicted oxidoreductase